MPKTYELKPNKKVFVTYNLLISLFFTLIFFLTAFFSLKKVFNPILIIVGFSIIILIRYFSLIIKYKKEKYIFYPNKIIRKGGGIFSEYEVELIVKNITHVTARLPFIENKLFKTGSISIEAAGTGTTEVLLKNINNPIKLHQYVEKVMKYNGFKLKKTKLIQQERPSSIGVFFEVFNNFFKVIFGILLYGIIFGAQIFRRDSFYLLKGISSFISIIIVIVTLLILLLLIKSFFNFLDLKKRVYSLYNDSISYKEGFLTKNYSFIPMENLSDSSLTQTFVDKIFGLYHIKVSCQGSKQEILFKNMRNGKKLENNIDNLVNKSSSLIGKHKEAKIKKESSFIVKDPKKDTKFTAIYKMHAARTIIPSIIVTIIIITLIVIAGSFFPYILGSLLGYSLYIPIIFILFIIKIIKVYFTKFYVKPKSMEVRFNFITQKDIEFTNDKIMGIIVKESFIDKWFKTCNIIFWSIGSSQKIHFNNIKKTPGLVESILAKSGINNQQVLYKMNSNFSFFTMLKAILPFTILSIIIISGLTTLTVIFENLFLIPLVIFIFIFILNTIYKIIFYNRSKLTFYKDFVYHRRGIFFNTYFYALYNNIKDITTVKYPFSKFGSITFNVAGESVISRGRRGQQQIVSNHFKINYIDEIDTKDESIDLIFHKRPTSQQINKINKNIQNYIPKTILLSKPSAKNPLTVLILFSTLLFFFLILLPITIPLGMWFVRVKSYKIQSYRVVAKSGILYKKQKSIIFKKINHINFNQGILNKMYNNGNIEVITTGTSRAEMKINNIPNYKEFYDLLKKYY